MLVVLYKPLGSLLGASRRPPYHLPLKENYDSETKTVSEIIIVLVLLVLLYLLVVSIYIPSRSLLGVRSPPPISSSAESEFRFGNDFSYPN